MPTKKAQRNRLPEHKRQPTDFKLKDFIVAAKEEWYASQGLSPGLGRPARQVQFRQVVDAIEALRLVFQRLQQRRYRRPDRHYPLFTQGQLRKWVTRRLNRNGLKVNQNNQTVRYACKALKLTRGRNRTMASYTFQEWAWLAKHGTKSDRERTKNKLASFIEDSAVKLEELRAIRLKPNPKGIDLSRLIEWEISHYTKRKARYERVITLF